MSEQKHCSNCGKPVPGESPRGICPACLMEQAMASRTIVTGQPDAELPPPRSPEEIADKFPQYEVLECLGRGGMGVVYKARQKSLDRWVAIKVLAPERVHEERFAEHFEREAKTLAKMSHPNIVTVFDHGETGGLFYIVMEFVDGVNLRDLLREGKMEPEQALAIIPPICEALQYAHDKGVVHRDIKPENLLLDREGRIKIADFGIASLVGASGENSGTPPYMAPEQSGGTVDRRADIYALGVVLYEMLTGERPDKDLVAPSSKVQIDVKIDEMVLRALEKEPERRYQTAGEFRTVVETMVMNLPASEKTAPIREDGTDESFSRGVWLPYVGLITLLAGVWWVYIWRYDPVEGRAMRPIGVLVAVVGLLLMLKGLLQAVGNRGVDFGYSRRTGSSHHSKDVDHESVVSPETEARRWKSLRLVSLLGFIVLLIAIAVIVFGVKIVPQWEESLSSRNEAVPTGMALVFWTSHFIQRVWPLMAPLLLILGVGSVTGYVVAARRQNNRTASVHRASLALTFSILGALIPVGFLWSDSSENFDHNVIRGWIVSGVTLSVLVAAIGLGWSTRRLARGKAAMIAASLSLLIAGASIIAGLQQPIQFDTPIIVKSPDGSMSGMGMTLHSMRVFDSDRVTYRLLVEGANGSETWMSEVPLELEGGLARPLNDLSFEKRGKIDWSEDGETVSFRVGDTRIAVFDINTTRWKTDEDSKVSQFGEDVGSGRLAEQLVMEKAGNSQEGKTFGAAKEAVLPIPGDDFRWLDLESGKFLRMEEDPEYAGLEEEQRKAGNFIDFHLKDKQASDWRMKHRVDVAGWILERPGALPAVIALDLSLVHLEADQWETLTAQELDVLLRVKPETEQRGVEGEGAVMGFRTREGSLGMLQIIGLSDDESGVKVRYKIKSNDIAGSDDEPNTSELANSNPEQVEVTVAASTALLKIKQPDGSEEVGSLRAEGIDLLQKVLSREPDHVRPADRGAPLEPPILLEWEGKKYAVQSNNVVLIGEKEWTMWLSPGIDRKLIEHSDVRVIKGKIEGTVVGGSKIGFGTLAGAVGFLLLTALGFLMHRRLNPDRRVEITALFLCVAGVILPLMVLIGHRLGMDRAAVASVAFVLFAVMQLAALILGIIRFSEPLGRAAAITSGVMLLCSILFLIAD